MRKTIATVTITMLLIMPLLLVIPLPAVAEPTEALSDAVGGGTGGEFWLDPSIIYYDGVTITGDTRIYGQGAMIDLLGESIKVVDAYLYIERCVLDYGAVDTDIYGALEFYNDASGFVHNNVIVDSRGAGIYIEDSSNIIIKENSILYSSESGINFTDSTNLTILENTIKNNEGDGIYGFNGGLYDEDPNSLQNIKIKGNNIGVNDEANIYLENVTGASISSNLIYSAEVGIYLEYCPIVSITHNKILSNEDGGICFEGGADWPDVTTSTGDHTLDLSLTISYNKIMSNYEVGIYIEDTQNVVITYNEIVGSEEVGILLDSEISMEPVLIAYNSVIGNGEAGIEIVDDVSHLSILFNKIIGYEEVGIHASTESDSEDLLIKGNVINYRVEEGEASISVEGWNAPVVIEWNTIISSGSVMVEECENPQILYNTIMYSGEIGLVIGGCEDGGRIAYNTVVYSLGYNIVIIFSIDVIVEHNTVIGALEESGIGVEDSDDITIQNNNIHNNYEDGIYWDNSSGLITNNIIGHSDGGTPSTSLSGQWTGIHVEDCLSPDKAVTISDNTIIGNYDGIYSYDSNPTIIRNYIANNVWGITLADNDADDPDPLIGGSEDNRNYIIRNYADGIYIWHEQCDPVITYNNIFENAEYGINNPDWSADFQDNARNNYWGHSSGPGGAGPVTPFAVGPGIGDEITNNFTYSPWLVSIIP